VRNNRRTEAAFRHRIGQARIVPPRPDTNTSQTKARYAFIFGDFRRLYRMGLIACDYRAAEWEHTEIMLAAHKLLVYLDQSRAPVRRTAPPASSSTDR
jgi:hypothetical protein